MQPVITLRLKRLAKTYRYRLTRKARSRVERLIQRATENWDDHPDEWNHPCWCPTCLSYWE